MTVPASQQPDACIAGVALDAAAFSYDQLYSYRVPASLADQLREGMRVLVPFGSGNRPRLGMVLTRSSGAPAAQTAGGKSRHAQAPAEPARR